MVRRFGFSAQLPMFLPGFGAYVKWNGANVDAGVRAQISLAGPLFGFVLGLICVLEFSLDRSWSVAGCGAIRGLAEPAESYPGLDFRWRFGHECALGAQGRLAVLLVSLVLLFMLHEWVFLVCRARNRLPHLEARFSRRSRGRESPITSSRWSWRTGS